MERIAVLESQVANLTSTVAALTRNIESANAKVHSHPASFLPFTLPQLLEVAEAVFYMPQAIFHGHPTA